jgi:integrase
MSGSIAKVGKSYKVRWRVADGSQRAKRFGRKRDAELFLVTVQADQLTGRYVDPRAGAETVGAYAARWASAQVWRPSSRARMEHIIRSQIVPVFGRSGLASVRRSEVQGWVRRMSDSGLAPSTVEGYFRCLAAIFISATKDKLLHDSPCVDIALPRSQTNRASLVPLTVEQVDQLAASVNERFAAMVRTQAGLGLRQGELKGLTVDRVNFLKREVTIDRQLIDTRGGVPTWGPPKTTASNRVIPLPSTVADVLAAHLSRWPAGEHGLIFTNTHGKAISRSQFSKTYRVAASAIGVDATSHDLRHHCASLLISAACSVKAVQSFLGHATAAETLDTYGHLFEGDEDRIRDAIDAALTRPISRPVSKVRPTGT